MKKILIILFIMSQAISAESNIEVINKTATPTLWEIECISKAKKNNFVVSTVANGTSITLKTFTDMSTLTYFLIDSSVPMRSAYKRGIKPFLLKNIDKIKKKNTDVVISTFDKNLVNIYDSQKEKSLTKSLKKVKISGQRTELWRNAKAALVEIGKTKYKRKILVLMSDGAAEDTAAYPIGDVIDYAKVHNIRIASLAYLDTIAIQNLRKISEETKGGLWIVNKKTHKLSKKFLGEFDKFINAHFLVNLPNTVLMPVTGDEKQIKLTFTQGKKSENVLLSLPTKDLLPPQTFLQEYKLQLLIGAAVVLILLIFLLLKPKKEEVVIEEEIDEHTFIPDSYPEAPKPIAFLESMGGTRHEIFKFPSTIGKKESNDVIIDGSYISRNHAVIDLKDGTFYLTDTNSANGTLVNGERVEGTVNIEPNDKIEFGPYKVSFVLN